MQVQMAENAGSQIVRCAAGHTPMIGVPGKIVEVIVDAVSAA